MAREDGTASHALEVTLQKMTESPYRFDFYHAMRLLECVFADAPRYGHSVRLSDDKVRLTQEPSLAFAPASLSKFSASEQGDFHRMAVRFFGLCGPNGALPLHLTEYVRDRLRHHDDPTFAAFLDVFHHRMLSLFYRAHADAQPTSQFDRPDDDRFQVFVASLMGTGMQSLQQRDEFPDLAKLFYAGRFACQAKNPEALQDMIGDFFQLPCKIQEFVGEWTQIPNDYQFQLGGDENSSTLGVACTVGPDVWQCQQKFRIKIGPVRWEDFIRMLPEGRSLDRLSDLVKNYIGEELAWDLNLILRQEDTPSWQLGHAQLGETMWLDNEGVTHDPDDLLITL
ncbi:type VI secretion system baseplate subunit TssG [Stieleria sp. JC731]|uniref:type VI secretion system baseplate subunit TssG n=1 Tax=Pirellulaceae TaxID=2691357 RepID=UPI001E4C94D5|nr:type VI secretion system baseplate subunit TssG [Stieleria sp. JC731]MCC9601125.1 type VI secretion system baseplate subunit TssG [Stieleria sp. JC731]